MSNNIAFVIGAALGITIGMLYEHQRFVKEMQSISRRHNTASSSTVEPTAAPLNQPYMEGAEEPQVS